MRQTGWVARSGLEPALADPHSLRHFYASLLIRHGESVRTVQARLGHASAAETLDTYSHLWPDSDDRTRAPVDSVLAGAEDELEQRGLRCAPDRLIPDQRRATDESACTPGTDSGVTADCE